MRGGQKIKDSIYFILFPATAPGRQTELPPGPLCRTIYLQRCRGRLVASGTYDANGHDNERIRHCNRQRVLQACFVGPAGTDNTLSWLASWRF